MLGSEVKLPMLGSDALADIGRDLGGGSPVCMTPQATPAWLDRLSQVEDWKLKDRGNFEKPVLRCIEADVCE